MCRLLSCGLLLLATPAMAAFQTVKVVDADGKPVAKFHAMFQYDGGSSVLLEASDGKWSDTFDEFGDVIDVAVGAEGYVTAFQRFEDASLEQLLKNQAVIRLDRGREIKIQLNLPEGLTLPEGLRSTVISPSSLNAYTLCGSPELAAIATTNRRHTTC